MRFLLPVDHKRETWYNKSPYIADKKGENMMKKWIALLLVLTLVLGCAACGTEPDPTQPPTVPATQLEATVPDVTVENPANYIQLSISYGDCTYVYLTAYEDGMGGATVEYQGDVKKVATMDPGVLHAITAQLDDCGLEALNGENVEGTGADYASMYVSFADGSYWGAGYNGEVTEAFMTAYNKLDDYFRTLLADVPEYVPQPQLIGEVEADALAEMNTVLKASGMEPLDMFCIMDVSVEEAFTAGLSDAQGVVNITSCAPMMMATAYSFVIATVEDEASIEAVRQDFAANLDWAKWVCVTADHALIARKGNMVVCVMASGDLYGQTKAGIEQTGWTDIEVIENPNL